MEEQLKAVGYALVLIMVGMLVFSVLGLDSGRGGNPQEGYQDSY